MMSIPALSRHSRGMYSRPSSMSSSISRKMFVNCNASPSVTANRCAVSEKSPNTHTDSMPTAPATRRQYNCNSVIVGARMPSGMSISMPSISSMNSDFGREKRSTGAIKALATIDSGSTPSYTRSMSSRQICRRCFFSFSGAGSSAMSSISRQKA